jgi:hypothetical protein
LSAESAKAVPPKASPGHHRQAAPGPGTPGSLRTFPGFRGPGSEFRGGRGSVALRRIRHGQTKTPGSLSVPPTA